MDPVERAGRAGRAEHVARTDRAESIERVESVEREGGEPACWLNLVCEECGKVREGGRCPVCDAGAGPSVAEADSGS
ncbi:hypothetical protein [Kitasatospora griseola]|uniref:hypothetical protein n=1 Tax=Kitasatospora griseola TaxID=2064 RepID=UPI003816DA1C